MSGMLAAPAAKLFQIKFLFHALHVLVDIIVDALARGTLELDEILGKFGLSHDGNSVCN